MSLRSGPAPQVTDADAPPGPGEKRALRALTASSMMSKVADWQLGLVIPLAVLDRTGSVVMSLLSIALRGMAYVASPLLGALIDRFDRRTVFVFAQVQQALSLALIAVLLSHPVPLSVLLLFSGFGAVASTITGQFVLIPSLVSRARRPAATARLSSAVEFSKVIGLLLGGVLFSSRGPVVASFGIAALYFGAGLLAMLLPRLPPEGKRTRLRADLALGFRWLVKPELLWLVVTMSVVNLAIGELETALITQFTDKDLGARAISVVLAVGLLVGAVGSRFAPSFLAGRRAESRILVLQVIGFGTLGLIATPWLVVGIVGYTALCLAVGASNVLSITYRQNSIPVELAGRVNATIRMFITGSTTLSGLLYAGSSRLSGFRFWLPGLCMWGAAIAVWSLYIASAGRLGKEDRGALGEG
ncbi:MFS transporter [Streptomyces sp. NPDC021224]|uniref:MFS transporter n=1 Tax=unclassified Streptomyces TaxID=2593676 RepID=UPI0037929771